MSDVTQEPPRNSVAQQLRNIPATTWFGIALLVIISLLLALLIGVVFFTEDGRQVLENLRDHAYARGVITFLIAVATIAIALALVVSVLSGIGQERAPERFNRGREVLTLLIGVLGTIVGFYFGTSASAPSPPAVSPPLFELQAGESEFTAFVAGGLPPYRYSITFDPPTIEAVADKMTDGWIRDTIDVGTGQTVSYVLQVTDASGRLVILEGQGTSLPEG